MDAEQAKSIYGLVVLTAWADRHLHPSEVVVENAIALDVPEVRALDDKPGIAAAAKRDLDELGLDAAVAKLAAPLQGRHDRELTFACCVRILEADRILAREEFRVLRILRRLFGLSEEDVSRLLARSR